MTIVPPSAILLATRSQGKLRELEPMFAAAGLDATDLDTAGVAETVEEAALEVFETFEENALAKARYFFRRTGMPSVGDDSGLCVVALKGEPGVFSKRWSRRPDLSGQPLDDENNRLLIERLRGVGDRRAFYVCVAAYVDGGRELVCCGAVHGHIVDDASGDNGFGYDPYFYADELGATFGGATLEAKQGVSHRGRAFGALVAELSGWRRSEIRG
ncbi:MAG: non-canonical purine NTP pyrophosphatase [Gemmatimonadaceae bacterium]